MWNVTHRDTITNGRGYTYDVAHIECMDGEFEGACVIIEIPAKEDHITHEEMAAEARAQGTPINAFDIDG